MRDDGSGGDSGTITLVMGPPRTQVEQDLKGPSSEGGEGEAMCR